MAEDPQRWGFELPDSITRIMIYEDFEYLCWMPKVIETMKKSNLIENTGTSCIEIRFAETFPELKLYQKFLRTA